MARAGSGAQARPQRVGSGARASILHNPAPAQTPVPALRLRIGLEDLRTRGPSVPWQTRRPPPRELRPDAAQVIGRSGAAPADRRGQQVRGPAVRRRRRDPRDLRPAGEARGSALLLAAHGGCGHPGRGDPARRPADEEAPCDVGRREEGGVRADDRLLGQAQKGRAQKESREVTRRPAGWRVRAAAGRLRLPR